MFARRIFRLGLIALLIHPVAMAAGAPQERPAAGRESIHSAGTQKTDAPAARKADLRPKPPKPVADAEITAAIQRGVDFLLKDQNDDGSWGSPERTKGLNIMAGIGSHQAFRAAVTALCVSALIEVGGPRSRLSNPTAVVQAIERGEEFLCRELPLVRRDDPMLIYNIWAHAYGIQALVRMHGRRPDDSTRRARIEELIRGQYDRLTRYEAAEGGWGYYDFGAGTQRPNSDSCSFGPMRPSSSLLMRPSRSASSPRKSWSSGASRGSSSSATQISATFTASISVTCP